MTDNSAVHKERIDTVNKDISTLMKAMEEQQNIMIDLSNQLAIAQQEVIELLKQLT